MRDGFFTINFEVDGIQRTSRWVRVLLFVMGISLTCGCQSEHTSPHEKGSLEPFDSQNLKPSAQIGHTLPTNRTEFPAAGPVKKTYGGLTLESWESRLKELGPGAPGASEAVEGLSEIVADQSVNPLFRRQAALMLGRLGQPALKSRPVLVALLSEPPTETEIPAAWGAKALSLWGPLAKETAPALIATLEGSHTAWEARLACLEALARIGGHHPAVVPALIRQISRPVNTLSSYQQIELQGSAIDAIALIGPAASMAVPTLMDQLVLSRTTLVLKSTKALGSIGPTASPASTALAEKLLFHDDEEVRRQAAVALSSLGEDGILLLVKFSQDEEDEVRLWSVQALAQSDRLSSEVVRQLVISLRDEVDSIRLVSAMALIRAKTERDQVLSILTDLFVNSERRISLRAVDALLNMKLTDEEISQVEQKVLQLEDEARVRLWQRYKRLWEKENRPDSFPK